MRPAGCGFRREPGAALKKNGPTRLGLGRAKVGFAHAPVHEQGDVKHIARRMSRDQLIRCLSLNVTEQATYVAARSLHTLYAYWKAYLMEGNHAFGALLDGRSSGLSAAGVRRAAR